MLDLFSLDLFGIFVGTIVVSLFVLVFLYCLRSPEEREAEKLAKNP